MQSFLTVEEYAAILRVNPRTIYRRCKRGEIKHKREGRAIRIFSSELEAPITESEKVIDLKKYIFST